MIVDHIGYLVKDMERSIESFEKLGYVRDSKIFEDNEEFLGRARNIRICFMKCGDTCIELVSPMKDIQNDVSNQLLRQGEGPYHICYKVKELEKTVSEMKSKGWIVTKAPMPAIALSGASVAFLFKNSVGLIELVEDQRP